MYRKSKVTVIIPVYQAIHYLRRCIDSILNQTYKNIEILLIDDGSNDGGEVICDEYAARYSHIFSFHQKNSGVASARNLGICKAEGEFILFVDSDDFIEEKYVENAIQAFSKENIDLYICGYQEICKKRKGKKYLPGMPTGIYERVIWKQKLMYLYGSYVLHAIGTKVYKKRILEKNQIRFREDWKFNEDIFFCLRYMTECGKIFISNVVMYNYQIDAQNSLLKRNYENRYFNIKQTYELLAGLVCVGKADSHTQKLFYTSYAEQIDYYIRVMAMKNRIYSLEIKKLYQNLLNDVFYRKSIYYMNLNHKVVYIFIRLRLFRLAYYSRGML